MKKWLKVVTAMCICAIIGVVGIMPVAAADSGNPTFSVDKVSGTAGDTVTVNINVKNNPGFSAAKVKVAYDANVLELTNVSNGTVLSEGIFQPGSLTQNPVIVLWSVTSDSTKNGVLGTLTFKIKDGATLGKSQLTLTYDQDDVCNTQLQNVAFDIENGSVTVEAKKYTVTFKDWNGTVLKTEQVAEGAAATAPSNPTREGYTFTNWNIAFNNITANTEVMAAYTINQYKVTFKDHDGTPLKEENVDYNTAATAPSDPTREGYRFTGWDKSFDAITGNTDITAQYVKTWTVTFKDEDGTVLKTETVDEGTAATAPTDLTKEGHIFTGWDGDFQTITSDKEVTAQYTAGYEILEGANSVWSKGDMNGIRVRSNGAFANFTGIKVDGVEVPADNYTAESGSTIVTLNASYLETLAQGNHTLTMLYTSGEVSTEFTIISQSEMVNTKSDDINLESSQTGDETQIVIWTIFAGISFAVLAYLGYKKYKNNSNA